jgi:hypothetical protein
MQLEWNRRIVEWITNNKVPHVIMVARWEHAVPEPLFNWRTRFNVKVWQEHFPETISVLGPVGTRVWFLMQVPFQAEDPRGGLTRGVAAKEYEAQQYEVNKILKSCRPPMFTVLGPDKCWFDKDGFSCMGDSGGSYYMDKSHVSSYGAKKLIRPLLEPVFDEIKETRQLTSRASRLP